MGKHLVLISGGHARMTFMLNLHEYVQRDHWVTLIGPSPYHYYSGMGPGLLSCNTGRIRFCKTIHWPH